MTNLVVQQLADSVIRHGTFHAEREPWESAFENEAFWHGLEKLLDEATTFAVSKLSPLAPFPHDLSCAAPEEIAAHELEPLASVRTMVGELNVILALKKKVEDWRNIPHFILEALTRHHSVQEVRKRLS